MGVGVDRLPNASVLLLELGPRDTVSARGLVPLILHLYDAVLDLEEGEVILLPVLIQSAVHAEVLPVGLLLEFVQDHRLLARNPADLTPQRFVNAVHKVPELRVLCLDPNNLSIQPLLESGLGVLQTFPDTLHVRACQVPVLKNLLSELLTKFVI